MQTTSATYQNSTFASTLTFGKSVSNAYRYSELSNHLGNVLSVISDKPIPHDNGGSVDYFLADIKISQDYSPFGVTLSGRYFSTDTTNYSRGFQGQEKEREITPGTYSAEFWMYESRLARRWNLDPVVKEHESPYAAFANNPIWFIDPNGADTSFANEDARKDFIETYNEVSNKVKGLDKAIDEKLSQWKEKGYDKKTFNKKMTSQIKNLNSTRALLLEIKDSFDDVIQSDIKFHYKTKPNSSGKYTSGGGTRYNPKEKRVDIWYYSKVKPTLVHETRHGSGYIHKEWGWDNEKNKPTNYDYQDEYDAYRLENNYNKIILFNLGRTLPEIKELIEKEYGGKDFIIKEYRQYCEPAIP